MTTTRWIVIGTAIVALFFVALLIGYPSETRTADENKNPRAADQEKAQSSFSWLDIDILRPRLESSREEFENGHAPLSVDYACGEEPLRIAEFTLVEGNGVRIIYELGKPVLDGCDAPAGLRDPQELCLYREEERALNGRCDENDFHLSGAFALGPGRGEIRFEPLVVIGGIGEDLSFKVKLD